MADIIQTVNPTKYSEALWAAGGLALYRNLLKDPICQAMVRFLELVNRPAAPEEILDAYGELFFLLAERKDREEGERQRDAWQKHLLDLALYDDNAFTRGAALAPLENLGVSLKEAAKGDLKRLQTLYRVDAAAAREAVLLKLEESRVPVGGLPLWEDLDVSVQCHIPREVESGREIKSLLAGSGDWCLCLQALARYHREYGAGIFARYRGFRWVRRDKGLEGIAEPDPIRFEDLFGYQSQRQEVVANTERFLGGFPTNNMLLYGDRGTGKSSTVKALLNQYGDRGLRLVEVAKSDLGDFPMIVRQLRQKPQRFIIFVDDLSFEESEVEYKELKAVLEGGLAIRPANVLVYATSNRRHLVRERLSDREAGTGQNGEIRVNDTVQEKLSLADRFGITVLFTTPDRALYLDIVRGLAEKNGLSLAESELERRALLWESWQNGRSGRTARQFIDHLIGEPL